MVTGAPEPMTVLAYNLTLINFHVHFYTSVAQQWCQVRRKP